MRATQSQNNFLRDHKMYPKQLNIARGDVGVVSRTSARGGLTTLTGNSYRSRNLIHLSQHGLADMFKRQNAKSKQNLMLSETVTPFVGLKYAPLCNEDSPQLNTLQDRLLNNCRD